jgi:hypothetical protein
MPGEYTNNCGSQFSVDMHAGFMHFITESKSSNQGLRYVVQLPLTVKKPTATPQLAVDEQQKQQFTTSITESVATGTNTPSPAAGADLSFYFFEQCSINRRSLRYRYTHAQRGRTDYSSTTGYCATLNIRRNQFI